jgi:hypothetical protein
MANLLYANNAAGTLAAGISNSATSVTLNAGQAALFPNPSAPQVFYATLTDAATQTLKEIVKVTAVSGNIFSIVRAQDGTAALSWNANDIIEQCVIRLELNGFENAAEGNFAAQGVAVTPSTTLGIAGTTLADNANAGSVGEYMFQLSGLSSLTNGVALSIASVTLTAGDWDVSGVSYFLASGGAQPSGQVAGTSTTNNTIGALGSWCSLGFVAPANAGSALVAPSTRYNVTTTTIVYLVAQAGFTSGSATAQGFIRARRIR